MKATSFVVIVVLVFLLWSCASEAKRDDRDFDTAALMGMIYDVDGQPCSGVTVKVDGSAGLVTDIRGRFALLDVRRGAHTIIATKQGFEDLTVEISFLNRTDILHLQMVSFGQLLDLAETAMSEQRWADAKALLVRAEKLNSGDAVLAYMFAVHAYRSGDYAEAVKRLEGLTASGRTLPVVYLFLAEVYEKGLKDTPKAIASLESYLKLRSDPDAEARLETMKKGQLADTKPQP